MTTRAPASPPPGAFRSPPTWARREKHRQPGSGPAKQRVLTDRLERWGYTVLQIRRLQSTALPVAVEDRLASIQQLDARRQRLGALLGAEAEALRSSSSRGWDRNDYW